jgi:hypothetical protein
LGDKARLNATGILNIESYHDCLSHNE